MPAAWPGEDRLAAIPGQIKELMQACNGAPLSGAIVFAQVQVLEAEQASLEAETPRRYPGPIKASPAVVAKAEHRGARWSPDRVEVVWRA